MKRLYSVGFMVFTVAMVLISSAAFSQATSDDAEAEVTAEVLTDISVTNIRNVDFAGINQDITTDFPTIDPDDAGGDDNMIGAPTVGVFHITGTDEQNILFGAGNFAAIQLVNGDFGIDFTPALYGVPNELSSDARGTGGNDLSSGNSDTMTGGEYTVYVGGVLDNPVENEVTTNSLDAGSYTGTYTLTVEYD